MSKHEEDFFNIDEARFKAGFLVCDVCKELGISMRTWYRWKAKKFGPAWAYKYLELMAGELTNLGWKDWYIEDGVLYNHQLSRRYYRYEAAHLLVTTFCTCPGHVEINKKKLNSIKRTKEERDNIVIFLFTIRAKSFKDGATRALS